MSIYHQKKTTTHQSVTCVTYYYFCFDSNIYQQNNGVAISSPLGFILDGAFMVKLESSIIPIFTDIISHWRRYVDDNLYL